MLLCDPTLKLHFPQCITKHKFANNPKTLQLFQREVSILESLNHVGPVPF